MFEIYRLEVAKTRQGVKRAENSLKRANELLDEDGGVDLISRCAAGYGPSKGA
ncbi:hypothetical protein [Mesorhizobium muleiense]|uniref:hypothetical protein n=1 Tax=Mesorhizobium muleiense TaxID=1004279 RepID=UPI001F48D504|nr:hypothetical protein [Mesorhizobium muleiense]MCF6110316.1 hypothetical protein [Mesorhizobium muleiense]